MKELSIFIDESGDFGEYDYIVDAIFGIGLSRKIEGRYAQIIQAVNNARDKGTSKVVAVDIASGISADNGPIIRKEEEYSEMDYIERRKIFNKMVTFMRQSGVKYKAFHIEKKHIEDIVEATGKLSKQISVFIREHYDFLLSFDLVKIYYDNGQVELNKILSTLFNAFLPRVEFRKVKPSDYRLFQVADMICTFELLKLKIQNHSFSKSEQIFFGSVNDLKRNYLKIVKRQDIDH